MTPSRIVLIIAHMDEQWVERLRKLSPELHIEHRSLATPQALPNDLWDSAEVIYTFPWTLPPAGRGQQVRWIHLYSAGADAVLSHPLFLQTKTIFTTSSGAHAVNMAEYVLNMTLAWFQHFPQRLANQQQKKWPPESEKVASLMADELWGKTIGIVGYGSIGRQVARLASAFGMHVHAMQNNTDHHDSGFNFPGVGDPEGTLPERYYMTNELPKLLAESDIVVIAVPLTPQTRGMFNRATFQAMKRTAFLVNIARGEICNEADLIEALEEQQIAGAALDVFAHEPLSSESPLWRLPNVFVTPHVSGYTPHYNERTSMIFQENLRRYLAGESLYNVVDKTRGY